MKSSKKRVKKRKSGKRIAEVAFGIVMIGVIVFAVQSWLSSSQPPQIQSADKAALIDQLSIAYPNPSFTEEFIRMTEAVGLTPEIFKGSEVTLDLYKRLPSMGYRLIVFRVHQSTPAEVLLPYDHPVTGYPVYLFTGEPYNEHKYVVEQLSDLVVPAREINGSNVYFSIGPEFVQSMNGEFQNTVIVLAGCSGLYSAELADSFIIKGASIVLGWQRFVQMDYTDKAIDRLLRAILLEKTTFYRSVLVMTSEIGLDPTYKTNLLIYPEVRSNLTFDQAMKLEEKIIVEYLGIDNKRIGFSRKSLK
ncbi:hypothetical protein [[Eubacterium] cellulosolvens]